MHKNMNLLVILERRQILPVHDILTEVDHCPDNRHSLVFSLTFISYPSLQEYVTSVRYSVSVVDIFPFSGTSRTGHWMTEISKLKI